MNYRVIPSFPKYEVNEEGDVRRRTPATGAVVGRSLTHRPGWGGYPIVCLGGPRRFVHRLVADDVYRRPPDHEVNHKDLDRLNPSAWNLEYVTRSENALHAHANGVYDESKQRGEQKVQAKLTDTLVREIRSSSESLRVLARRLGVHHRTIEQARQGRTWKHVV